MRFFTAMLFSAIAAAPVLANETYTTEIVKQADQRWQLQRVLAYSDQEGTRVSGRMSAIRRFGLPQGHIDVAAYSPSGELLSEATTDYTPSILTRKKKQKGGVRFSVNLSENLPPHSVVKVAFHRNEHSPSSGPKHTNNIAR